MANPAIITKRVLMPKSSVTAPENMTGRRVAMVTKNQKFPKTLPRKPPGVASWRKVWEGIKRPTKEKPMRIVISAEKISLRPPGISGTKNAKSTNNKPNAIKHISIIFFFLAPARRSLGIKIAPIMAPIPAGTTIRVPAELGLIPRSSVATTGMLTVITVEAI